MSTLYHLTSLPDYGGEQKIMLLYKNSLHLVRDEDKVNIEKEYKNKF